MVLAKASARGFPGLSGQRPTAGAGGEQGGRREAATGHDKGGVEARGKGIRWQVVVPIPSGESLDEIAPRS
jgi:hypothetical protein